eukprot:CAMPEP_0113883220 /NCGR_PEP_ID=MMETSP0780_2-20120614/9448_1 /TAXON_ID=652834 /ORGANISM="Palpitomonas bilix" /LENGTH=161 /DNA_ID=CAMNT_0000870439 /DNA_START=289 /DNA_END=774 /DNA_ORIENTATION=+ /assembly_acc=CAM_ASM_000599
MSRTGVSDTVIDFLQEELVKYCYDGEGGVEKAQSDRLEAIGYNVGYKMMQRIHERPTDSTVSTMKFVCTEFWRRVFGREMDKMKTDHKKKFDCVDHHFRPFVRLSGSDRLSFISKYLYFPAGIIRGALANAGHAVDVKFDPAHSLENHEVVFSITFTSNIQ